MTENHPTTLMRWILKSEAMYEGNVHGAVLDRFRPIGKAALTRVVREIVRRSISAMEEGAARQSVAPATAAEAEPPDEVVEDTTSEGEADEGADDSRQRRSVVTTESELALFAIAKEQFDQSAFAKGTLYDTSARRDVPIAIAYKYTQNYFSSYVNKPSYWLIRARLEGRKPWLAFNLEPARATPLVPTELIVMPAYAWAPFRVQIASESDLHRLQRLFYATIQQAVDERKRPQGEAVQSL